VFEKKWSVQKAKNVECFLYVGSKSGKGYINCFSSFCFLSCVSSVLGKL